MKIGYITFIDQRNGSGIIRTDDARLMDYKFTPYDMTYPEFQIGDKVAFQPSEDSIERWATNIYKLNYILEDRLIALENRLAKLEAAYNIVPDANWIEGMHKALYGKKEE